jgi:hypothetical protein
MTDKKFYVCIIWGGVPQFYQRDVENKVNGRWTAVPTFVISPADATPMLEQSALAMVKRLRLLRADPWLQDLAGNRIDVPSDSPQSFTEDTRGPVRATLDDDAAVANGTAQWFTVKPANTVNGPRWYVKAVVPGRPEPDVIYSESPLGALQRAADIGFLQFCERDTAPAPKPQPVAAISNGPRTRPGDRY